MSTLEKQKTPQTQKTFEDRSQDHGSAAQQRGRDPFEYCEKEAAHEHTQRRHAAMTKAALADYQEGSSPAPAELEEAANEILAEYESEDNLSSLESQDESIDLEDLDEYQYDRFMTPEDFGIPSQHEITKRQGRRAMALGQPDFADDDLGDDDFDSHVRVRNKL